MGSAQSTPDNAESRRLSEAFDEAFSQCFSRYRHSHTVGLNVTASCQAEGKAASSALRAVLRLAGGGGGGEGVTEGDFSPAPTGPPLPGMSSIEILGLIFSGLTALAMVAWAAIYCWRECTRRTDGPSDHALRRMWESSDIALIPRGAVLTRISESREVLVRGLDGEKEERASAVDDNNNNNNINIIVGADGGAAVRPQPGPGRAVSASRPHPIMASRERPRPYRHRRPVGVTDERRRRTMTPTSADAAEALGSRPESRFSADRPTNRRFSLDREDFGFV